MSNETPKNTVTLGDMPEAVKSKLTPEEQAEVERARAKTTVEKIAATRLEILKRELSDTTEQKLTPEDLSSLVEEKGIIEKGMDVAQNIKDGAVEAAKNMPIVWGIIGAGETVVDAAEKALSPIETMKKLWDDLKNAFSKLFSDWDFSSFFESLKSAFSLNPMKESFKKGIDAASELLDLSFKHAAHWKDLLFKSESFGKITIAQFREHLKSSNLAAALGLSVENRLLEGFRDSFFGEENFKKMSNVVTSKGVKSEDIEGMTIGDFIKKLAA